MAWSQVALAAEVQLKYLVDEWPAQRFPVAQKGHDANAANSDTVIEAKSS